MRLKEKKPEEAGVLLHSIIQWCSFSAPFPELFFPCITDHEYRIILGSATVQTAVLSCPAHPGFINTGLYGNLHKLQVSSQHCIKSMFNSWNLR